MKAQEVIRGERQWAVDCADAVEWFDALPERSLSMVIGSPPYLDARTYGIGAQRDCTAWVEWMLRVTTAAHRATAGPVFWVVAGVTRDRCYWPGCEGLAWEWWKKGGDCQLYRPCIYRRVGIPGSGGDDYLRADWEYVLCFKHAGKLPWSDNTAMGHPPKWAPGGEMSHRLVDGNRVHKNPHGVRTDKPVGSGAHGLKKDTETYRANGRPHTKRKAGREGGKVNGYTLPDGTIDQQFYIPPVLANPGTVIQQRYSFTAEEIAKFVGNPSDLVDCVVGGGRMGECSALASANEAPYPESLPEFIIRSFCPPGGIVGDPFSGSGTTAAVAVRWGRRFAGCDLRQSQVDLTHQRLDNETPMTLFTEESQ